MADERCALCGATGVPLALSSKSGFKRSVCASVSACRQRRKTQRLVAEVATLTAERDQLRTEAERYPVPAFADDLHDFVADALRPYLQECGEEGDESWLVTAESAGSLADVALTALISAARLPGLADAHVMFEYDLAREQVERFAERQLALQAERDALAARLAQVERVVEAARAFVATERKWDGKWEAKLRALLAAVDALDGTAGKEGNDA